ncbi:MAG: tyrosine-type recombinase/integrase [Elusimicrobia bacterium]|nr:tyrosine-type recombinase/integrase [Elusimicrobiota bacterium]
MAIYKKGGNWFIDYYFHGRRIRESAGPSKSFAKEALAKRKTEIAEGKFFPQRQKETISFAEMCGLYWELYAKHKRGAINSRSLRNARHYIQRITVAFGDKKLDAVKTTDVLSYLTKLREHNSPATFNRHLAIIKSVFNRAIEWGKFMGPNPAVKIKKLQENNKRLRYLSKEEIPRLLESCHPRLFPLLACALWTGMRRGEILDLKWENVDLERRLLYVLESKSGKAREIPIAPTLARVFVSMGPKTMGPVFHVPIIMIARYFDQALTRAGIRDFRFHDLRHTFASHFIMKTQDLPALQKILGHASPMMTQRYAHLATGHLAVNMAKFDSGMDTFWTPRQIPALPNVQNSLKVRQLSP